MYNDIGRKLKTIANVCGGIVIAIACIVGIVAMFSSFWRGLLTIVLGSIIGWCGFASLYAIGELVDNSANNRAYVEAIYRAMPDAESHTPAAPSANAPAVPHCPWTCNKCGHKNRAENIFCEICGEYR